MIFSLSGMTGDIEKPVLLFHGEKTRYKDAPELRFLEENLFRYRKKTYTGEKSPRFSGISVFHAASPRQEIAETARRIRMQVREKGLQFGDIAVICGSLEEYAGLCREEFRKAGIPCFIDETHSVLMNPFVEFLRSCLEMVLSDFSEESVFRYLRCGLSDIEREETDALENYVHALGIRGKKKWQEKWLRLYKGMRPEELPPIEDCRSRFWAEVGNLAEGFGQKERTVREYAAVLYAFSVSCEAQKKLAQQEKDFHDRQELAMEKEYAQIYGTVMELLDRMVEVLGDERIRGREFLQILETGLSKAKVALIPPGQDQVLVGDMERTRLRDIKALYFVGVNEGNIPKSTQGGSLLNEIDRSFFASQGVELAPDAREQMSIQRFYLYLNLTKPSEYLCLSCPLADLKGEALSPSYLLRSLQGLFPLLQPEMAGESALGEGEERYAFLPEEASCGLGLFTRGLNERAYREQEPLFSELYSWYLQDASSQGLVKRLVENAFSGKPSDLISREAAKALYHEIPAGSATRLERYAACAFAHFAAYGLMLRPRQEYEFKA
ncbi:MAG: helicase-exonuclease AddAB subunit AddB, partial [Blautia sp.]|nr:helicase-exonuclease AddAB subunit AddB [Blautia sp.]